MPSFFLSIDDPDQETSLSLPAPPIALAHRLALATGLSTADLDLAAGRADVDGATILYAPALVASLAVELRRFEIALDSRLDSEGFLTSGAKDTNHFNDRQRLRSALKLFETAATQKKGVRVDA